MLMIIILLLLRRSRRRRRRFDQEPQGASKLYLWISVLGDLSDSESSHVCVVVGVIGHCLRSTISIDGEGGAMNEAE